MRTRSRRGAIALAAILATSVAVPASAATSAGVNETFSVNSTLAITLDTAAITYGALNPGAQSPMDGTAPQVTATISGNVPWELDILASAFTGPGGATIPVANRDVQLAHAPGLPGVTLTGPLGDSQTTNWYVPNSKANDATGLAGYTVVINSWWAVEVPTTVPAGSYTGQQTWTVTATP